MNGGRQLIDLYQKTVEDVKVTDSHSAGAFTLGLSPLFGACFFGDLIPNFSAAYPNIRITMIEDGANQPASRGRHRGLGRDPKDGPHADLWELSLFHPTQRSTAPQGPSAGSGGNTHGLPATG